MFCFFVNSFSFDLEIVYVPSECLKCSEVVVLCSALLIELLYQTVNMIRLKKLKNAKSIGGVL